MLLIPLFAATYTDSKSGEIPIWLFPLTAVLYMLDADKSSYFSNILAAAVIGIIFVLLALFFSAGGGDIIMMATIAFIAGLESTLVICLYSGFLLLGYYIYNKKAETGPFAPLVLCGYLLERSFYGV